MINRNSKASKGPLYNNSVLSDSMSELCDDEVRNSGLGGADTLDLPLKSSRLMQNSNFSDLDWDSIGEHSSNDHTKSGSDTPTNPGPSNKRVRFDEEDAAPAKSRADVEELLTTASEVNDFVGENLEKVNTLSVNGTPNGNTLYKLMSDVNTMGTTRTESLSNFDLSDTADDDPDLCALDSVKSNLLDNVETNIDNIIQDEDPSLSKKNVYCSTESESEHNRSGDLDKSGESGNSNDTLDATQKLSEINLSDFSEERCIESVREYLAKLNNGSAENVDGKLDETPLLYDPATISVEAGNIPVEEAIRNFDETLQLIEAFSQRDDMADAPSEEGESSMFDTFVMKKTASIGYHDFLERIQSKCMFGTIVYESATYLCALLLLRRDKETGSLRLKHKLVANTIHRIIIATIRIGVKLVEDFVHSHQYFCKVCGISKKLLSRLEVVLLLCLKDDRIVLTYERLASSVAVLHELRTYTTS
ncbi:Pcl8p KNAG_0D00990 [Huiozyma naganishii CBS 8797]|uniref:Uncharacterized protein n=1 Tax=Huiozyma naganishii (strain ATCC MYA-139 / BCRC 22969 / CBS 8797 / KCTC 17520 / NBRC 10181 / NCYC 3082 / Yp74L-3) TaxID=1071383 RepID=J7S6M0_HUIN7|nr:hypothetical protein KNAG_0D00990 [Kazachstania naganishii CBS 8797]CCK69851.1 hypothetical protein KNAG_0D00990 [Kazachstania naganishii CBS 8797]